MDGIYNWSHRKWTKNTGKALNENFTSVFSKEWTWGAMRSGNNMLLVQRTFKEEELLGVFLLALLEGGFVRFGEGADEVDQDIACISNKEGLDKLGIVFTSAWNLR